MSVNLGSVSGYQLQAVQLAVLTLGKESFDRCTGWNSIFGAS
jgi:hypothetical protein